MGFAEDLKSVLSYEDKILDDVLNLQKSIRINVIERDWLSLETNIDLLSKCNDIFYEYDIKRNQIMEVAETQLTQETIKAVLKQEPMFARVTKKLRISKIENDSLSVFVTITRKFLQSVFDRVIPTTRNTLYSSEGKIIQIAPSSIILNTVG